MVTSPAATLQARDRDKVLEPYRVVHRVYGGPVWCARRHDNHRKVINADTAEHLSEYLAEAEADHRE